MNREFVYTKTFDTKWKRMGLCDDDLRVFEAYLIGNPSAGDVMEGTGGIRKIRWVLPNTGKSGGVRVLYLLGLTLGAEKTQIKRRKAAKIAETNIFMSKT